MPRRSSASRYTPARVESLAGRIAPSMSQSSRILLLGPIALALGAAAWLFCSVNGEPEFTGRGGDGAEAAATAVEASLPGVDSTRATDAAASRSDAEALPAPADSDAATGPRIRVCVTDPDRKPVASAKVTTFADSTAGTVLTGEDGWCSLPVAPGGTKNFRVRIEAKDLWHQQSELDRRREHQIRLARQTRITGILRDRLGGHTVAAAKVTLPHEECTGCEPDSAVSAADGTFSLTVPTARNVVFVVAAAGFPRQRFSFRLPDPSGAVRHEFLLQHGTAIAGRVRDDSGAWLGVTAPDHCSLGLNLTAAEVIAGAELQILLPAGVHLVGTVRDEAGKPVAEADVFPTPNWDQPGNDPRSQKRPFPELPENWNLNAENWWEGQVKTDAEGRFKTKALVPLRTWQLHVSHPSFDGFRKSLGLLEADREELQVDVTLTRRQHGGVITGQLKLNGTPVAGNLSWKGPSRNGWGQADPEGGFRLEGVEPGAVELSCNIQCTRGEGSWLYLPVRELDQGNRLKLTVAADAEQQVVYDVTLAMSPISGSVLRADGSPAPDVPVWAADQPNQNTHLSGRTGPDGHWQIEVPGNVANWRVSAQGADNSRTAAPGATGIDFVIAERGNLRWRMLGADGLPVEGCRLLVRRGGEKGFNQIDSESPDLDGFRTSQLARGVVDLLAWSPRASFAPVLQAGITVAAAPVQVDFLMNRGAQITLRLAEGLENLQRYVLMEEPLSLAGVRPGDFQWGRRLPPVAKDRPAVVRGIGPGRVLLQPADASIDIEPAVIDVQPGRDVEVTVSWKKRDK
jgi:hypothetical protein